VITLDLPQLQPGLELPARTVHVDRERLVAYAEASGDHNPIHQDEEFARSVGLPDVIAHGMWTMGAAVEVVSDWAGDPTAVVSYGTRFVNPVVVPAAGGADLEVSGVVTKVERETGRVTVELTVTCGGTKVLGRASAVVHVPASAP
jgi:acyl dehydratase